MAAWVLKADKQFAAEQFGPNMPELGGQLWAIGGQYDANLASKHQAPESYDPVSNTWTSRYSLPLVISYHAAAALRAPDGIGALMGGLSGGGVQTDSFMYLIGGFTNPGAGYGTPNLNVYRYDGNPSAQPWKVWDPLPSSIPATGWRALTAIPLPNGKIAVFGGDTPTSDGALTAVTVPGIYLYTPGAAPGEGVWELINNSYAPTRVIGGANSRIGGAWLEGFLYIAASVGASPELWRVNVATGAAVNLGAGPQSPGGTGVERMVVAAFGLLHVFGGANTPQYWTWDPTTNTWTANTNMARSPAGPLKGAAAGYSTTTGMILAAGGIDGFSVFNDRKFAQAQPPPPPTLTAQVELAARSEVSTYTDLETMETLAAAATIGLEAEPSVVRPTPWRVGLRAKGRVASSTGPGGTGPLYPGDDVFPEGGLYPGDQGGATTTLPGDDVFPGGDVYPGEGTASDPYPGPTAYPGGDIYPTSA